MLAAPYSPRTVSDNCESVSDRGGRRFGLDFAAILAKAGDTTGGNCPCRSSLLLITADASPYRHIRCEPGEKTSLGQNAKKFERQGQLSDEPRAAPGKCRLGAYIPRVQ